MHFPYFTMSLCFKGHNHIIYFGQSLKSMHAEYPHLHLNTVHAFSWCILVHSDFQWEQQWIQVGLFGSFRRSQNNFHMSPSVKNKQRGKSWWNKSWQVKGILFLLCVGQLSEEGPVACFCWNSKLMPSEGIICNCGQRNRST